MIFFIILMFIASAYIVRVYFVITEKLDMIVNYRPELATQIFDRKNRLIANIFDKELRFYARFDEIPSKMIEALLAVEDTLFFEHNGINFDAILRAMVKNLIAGKYVEGGSTLTQQLVKNVALSRDKTLDRKLTEAILSFRVEQKLSKEEILERYLNETFFGHGYYGVKAAAQGYFKKQLQDLTLKEIAIIVGLPRAPSFYDPTRNLDFSLGRANNILDRMKTLGWISEEDYLEAIAEIPQVYLQTLTQNKAPYVVDETLRQLSYISDIRTGGYTIKLNIDLDYQKIAQEAVLVGYENTIARINARKKKLSQPQQSESQTEDSLNGAMIVTESKTGKILALVGGVDYAKSSFNRATQAKRQFGSSIKPFIYQIAFDNGYAPASKIPDVARSFNKTFDQHSRNQNERRDAESLEKDEYEYWRPKNFNKSFSGVVTLKNALSKSLNLPTINLVEILGFDKVYDEFEFFGFTNIPKDMTIALGSLSLTLTQAAQEYSIFSNYGTLVRPSLIESLTNFNGNTTFFQTQKEIITDPQQAYLTIDILQDVVKNGTGRGAKVKTIELAGKTGTSNNNIDAWFCGFSPTIQVIVWYGRDDNTPIGKYESGGVVAPSAFAYFFRNLLKIQPGIKKTFDIPKGVFKKNIGGETYLYTNISNSSDQNKLDDIQQKLIF
nr:PBP1A family penicillin-binding protein [Helicobacter enhydrae]